MKATDSGCTVVYCNFRGMTDPASVAILFLTCLLVGMLTKLPLPGLIAAGWTALVAGFAWFCTWLTESGQEGKDRPDEFLPMK